MYHTLRDVAKQTGMNKVTVFNHYKRLKHDNRDFIASNTKRAKNRILLDNKAYYKLLNSFNHLHMNDNNNVNSKAISTIVKLLKSELKDKNDRIAKLDKQNTNLNQMLKHQQELQLNEQRRNKSLTKTLNNSLEFSGNKHGFWYKLKHLF